MKLICRWFNNRTKEVKKERAKGKERLRGREREREKQIPLRFERQIIPLNYPERFWLFFGRRKLVQFRKYLCICEREVLFL